MTDHVKFSIILALKAIAKHPKLSGAAKAVGAELLDCFNQNTERCDPGVATLTRLTGFSRSTILRSVDELDALDLIAKNRHGGKYGTNSYRPNWEMFSRLNVEWKAAKQASRTVEVVSEMTPAHPELVSEVTTEGCQNWHLGGVENDTQTDLRNLSEEPVVVEEGAHDDLGALSNRLRKALGSLSWTMDKYPAMIFLSVPQSWLTNHCDLEKDVLPAIQIQARQMAARQDDPRSWKVFERRVYRCRDDRLLNRSSEPIRSVNRGVSSLAGQLLRETTI